MVYPQLALALVKIIVEVVLLTLTVLVALKIVGLFTKSFDEWEEIHKGNVSVAIYMAGMVISVGFIVQPGIMYFLNSLSLDLVGLQGAVVLAAIANGFVQLIVAFVIAMITQFLALNLLAHVHDLMAPYDEWEEMKKGNVAAGIIMGVILAAIGILLSYAMNNILDLIRFGIQPEILHVIII